MMPLARHTNPLQQHESQIVGMAISITQWVWPSLLLREGRFDWQRKGTRAAGNWGNKPRDWTKGKDFPGSALNFLGSHSESCWFPKKQKKESCWFAYVYDNPFQLAFLIVPNYLLWKIKKKRSSGWGDMVKVAFHISDCVVIFWNLALWQLSIGR